MTDSRLVQRVRGWLWMAVVCALASCSSMHKSSDTAQGVVAIKQWSGRISMVSEDPAIRSFGAAFELTGNAKSGTLRLSTPFGATIIVAQWDAAGALIQSSEHEFRYDGFGDLIQHALGLSLPPEAVFAWMGGKVEVVPGWTVSEQMKRPLRVVAERIAPPFVRLTLIVDGD